MIGGTIEFVLQFYNTVIFLPNQYWLLPNWAILMQLYPTRWSEVTDHWLCAILFGTIYVFMSSCLNAQSSSKNICHRTTIALLNIKKITFMKIRKQNNYSVFQLKTVFCNPFDTSCTKYGCIMMTITLKLYTISNLKQNLFLLFVSYK